MTFGISSFSSAPTRPCSIHRIFHEKIPDSRESSKGWWNRWIWRMALHVWLEANAIKKRLWISPNLTLRKAFFLVCIASLPNNFPIHFEENVELQLNEYCIGFQLTSRAAANISTGGGKSRNFNFVLCATRWWSFVELCWDSISFVGRILVTILHSASRGVFFLFSEILQVYFLEAI